MKKNLIKWINEKLGMTYTAWTKQSASVRFTQYHQYKTEKFIANF